MIFYDFEVFKYDWLVVLINPEKKTKDIIVNNPEQLKSYYESNKTDIWVGYNNVRYDKWILKTILCGFNPYEMSKHIIDENKSPWDFSSLVKKNFNFVNYDAMVDGSLKLMEGYLGNSIEESSVPFTIDRKLTDAEIQETIKYCTHDVEQTIEVFINSIDQFNTKIHFIKHYKLPLSFLEKTMAQLSCHILGGNGKGKRFDDEFDYPIVDCLDIKRYIDVVEFFKNRNSYGNNHVRVVAGIPHTFSSGGVHGNAGVIKNNKNNATPIHIKGILVMIDITAYYPSQQKQFKFGYRVMDNYKEFEYIHDTNIQYKRLGDKKARLPFKIMDNAISGQLKQPNSKLYDPMSNNSITVNGQLMLLDLIEHLEKELPNFELVQSNTDGILIKLSKIEDYTKLDDIVYEWECRTGMKMDFDLFEHGEIYQKDCNNYLLVDRKTGAVKRKGGYVKKLSPLDYDLPIVNKALVDFMINGVPVEKTINECDDMKEFQMVRRISKKYINIKYGDKVLNERCIRIYASVDRNDGGVSMLSGRTHKYEKIALSPTHCFIENGNVNGKKCSKYTKLDKQWYVDLAKKRLEDFGV